MSLIAIILTFNEEVHLHRCIESLQGVVDSILVVDSGSSDRTAQIAEHLGARVLSRKFKNHADQFNWALSQIGRDFDWVLRIDADEYLTAEIRSSITRALAEATAGIDGFQLRRGICFQGQLIRHGGVYPVPVVRLFRNGKGMSESRWMDEHIVVSGQTAMLEGDLIDENLNSLSWWTDKHNRYASREAVDVLNREYRWFSVSGNDPSSTASHSNSRRWLKENVYARLPGGIRAAVYFLYRYIFRMGFLDGRVGTTFHVLQGFWYRYLVDAKIYEVRTHMNRTNCAPHEAVIAVLGIDPREPKI